MNPCLSPKRAASLGVSESGWPAPSQDLNMASSVNQSEVNASAWALYQGGYPPLDLTSKQIHEFTFPSRFSSERYQKRREEMNRFQKSLNTTWNGEQDDAMPQNVEVQAMAVSDCLDLVASLISRDAANVRKCVNLRARGMVCDGTNPQTYDPLLTDRLCPAITPAPVQLRGTTSNCAVSTVPGEEKADEEKLKRVRAIEQTLVQGVNVPFSAVAGLGEAKQLLQEAVIIPSRFPHFFTGKTRLAQAVATETQSAFYSVSSSDLVSSWVGESEKLIRELFAHARQQQTLSVIFIDEIDSLCRARSDKEDETTRRIKTELLKQMDGIQWSGDGRDSSEGKRGVFLLAATNCPWDMDKAFLRRFQKRIYIPLPDDEGRRCLIDIHLGTDDIELNDRDKYIVVAETRGYSGSDLAVCMADALMEPIRELRTATCFKRCYDSGEYFVACRHGTYGSFNATLNDIDPAKVRLRRVIVHDVLAAIRRNPRTITDEDISRYAAYHARV